MRLKMRVALEVSIIFAMGRGHSGMAGDVGIVIPAYDPDPDRLVAYIGALATELDPARIHVELDCPTRAVTTGVADTVATVHAMPSRRGKGAAVTAGFDRLDTDVLAFVDADGSTPPESLAAVLDPIRAAGIDLSIGSRRHPQSDVRVHQSRIRRRLGDLFVKVARLILPVKLYDYQCGAKAVCAETWNLLREELVSPGFAWDIEFVTIADALGATVTEVPIVWDDQPGSTVELGGTTSEFAFALFRSWHRAGVIRGDPLNATLAKVLDRPTRLIEMDRTGGYEPTERR